MNKRVVVTGTGAITPIGNDVQTYWKNLLDGVCGIDFITSIPTDDLPVKIAGEVKDVLVFFIGAGDQCAGITPQNGGAV